MKPNIFALAALVALAIAGCNLNQDQAVTVPVDYQVSIDVNPVSPGLKTGQVIMWGSNYFTPQQNTQVQNYYGRIATLVTREISYTATGLPGPTGISEARMKFRVPNPASGPGDPIMNRWIQTGWYVENSNLENGVHYSLFPAADTASWNRLSRMLFANDTILVEWEGWNEAPTNAFKINITIHAYLTTL